MNIKSWNELEDFVKDLLSFDNSCKPKGSGSSKKEEDVVSDNIVVQCKYSDKINISIQKKDLDRLIDAHDILDKFPIFINKNLDDIVISLPVMDKFDDINLTLLKLIAIKQGILKLNNIKTIVNDRAILSNYQNTFRKIKKQFYDLRKSIEEDINKLENFIDSKYVSLNTYNLFDGDNSGS